MPDYTTRNETGKDRGQPLLSAPVSTNLNYRILDAQDGDLKLYLPKLDRLHREVVASLTGTPSYHSQAMRMLTSDGMVAILQKSQKSYIVVCEFGLSGNVAGSSIVTGDPHQSQRGWISYFSTHPEHRRRHVGTGIIRSLGEATLGEAKRRGLTTLHAMAEVNNRVRLLGKRWGFSETEPHSGIVEEAMVTLYRKL